MFWYFSDLEEVITMSADQVSVEYAVREFQIHIIRASAALKPTQIILGEILIHKLEALPMLLMNKWELAVVKAQLL